MNENSLINQYRAYCKTAAEEEKLIRIIQNNEKGCESAKNELIIANQYWALLYARKFRFSQINIDDLFSAALTGLLNSIKSFNPSKGIPFHNYAEYQMKGHILDCIDTFEYGINLPKKILTDIKRLKKVSKELTQNSEDNYSTEDIAKEMKVSEEYVLYLQSLKLKFENLDQINGRKIDCEEDDSYENENFIVEDEFPEEKHKKLEYKSILSPLDYEIYIRSVGLNGFSSMSHKDILKDINCIRKKNGLKKCTIEDIIIHYNRAVIILQNFEKNNF